MCIYFWFLPPIHCFSVEFKEHLHWYCLGCFLYTFLTVTSGPSASQPGEWGWQLGIHIFQLSRCFFKKCEIVTAVVLALVLLFNLPSHIIFIILFLFFLFQWPLPYPIPAPNSGTSLKAFSTPSRPPQSIWQYRNLGVAPLTESPPLLTSVSGAKVTTDNGNLLFEV